ncbi:MAG: hypothetical protein ACRCSE_07530 [Vibrio sp.]
MKKLITLILLSIFMIACSEVSLPDTSHAKPYQIVKVQGYATPNDKKGLEILITSDESSTFDSRAQTAIKAAIDELGRHGLYEVVIKMQVAYGGKNAIVANATYCPHGKNTWGTKSNTWDVSASSKVITPDNISDGAGIKSSYLKQE